MDLVLVSLLLILIGFVVFLVWYMQQRYSGMNLQINRRMEAIRLARASANEMSSADDAQIGHRERLLQWLNKYPWVQHLNRNLLRSGKDISLFEFLGVAVTIWLLCAPILMILGVPFFTSCLSSLAIASFPYWILLFLIRRRQNVLEMQLPEVLDFIARSLQAGHSFPSSMQMAGTESPAPIGQEFLLASNQINFGESVHNALHGLTQRIECPDMSYFAVAVLINREIGGDLSALLKHVAEMIRGRLQLRMSIHAMTGEARASAWILGLIPVVLGVALSVMEPEHMSVLVKDPIGRHLLFGGIFMMALGVLWMRKMINIRV